MDLWVIWSSIKNEDYFDTVRCLTFIIRHGEITIQELEYV
jgi:hypothetical protein